MKPVFEIRTSAQGKEYFVLLARNGKVILTGEEYESRQGLMNGIDSVRRNVFTRGAFKRRVAADGAPYFVLRAKNNKVIGVSETYSGKVKREIGITSVRFNARSADVRVAP